MHTSGFIDEKTVKPEMEQKWSVYPSFDAQLLTFLETY